MKMLLLIANVEDTKFSGSLYFKIFPTVNIGAKSYILFDENSIIA